MVKISGPIGGKDFRKVLNVLMTKYPNVEARYSSDTDEWEIRAGSDEVQGNYVHQSLGLDEAEAARLRDRLCRIGGH